MRVFHLSDIHISFSGEDGRILKPMDKRSWSVGSQNYVGYLEKIVRYFQREDVQKNFFWPWHDIIIVITGDLFHDMSKKHIAACLRWIAQLPGVKVIIRGNHDHQLDAGWVRREHESAKAMLDGRIILIEEGSFQCVGPYLFGCWSDHRNAWGDGKGNQPAFSNQDDEVILMAKHFVKMARIHKKVPIMLSHYPAKPQVAETIGQVGVRAYLSGHVHCTNGKVEGGTDWRWYDATAKLTDDQVIEGCFFSTGTTDVLLNKHGSIVKEITGRVQEHIRQPGPKPKRFVPPDNPAERMVVLAGIPGSGKSTYAKRLNEVQGEACGMKYEIISQDELGSKGAAIERCERALAAGKNVIIDRCNFSQQQRRIWIDLARKYKVKEISCVVMKTDVEACIERVLGRQGHPTLNDQVPPDRKVQIIRRFQSEWEGPTSEEGFNLTLWLDAADLQENS